MQSWKDTRLPNMLWACLLASGMKREAYFSLCHAMCDVAHARSEEAFQFITHQRLAEADAETFLQVMIPITETPDAISILRPIRLLRTLPDAAHWETILSDPVPETDWHSLAKAIALCFDHQSQPSTDVRWLKLMYFVASGKMRMPPNMLERLLNYPADENHNTSGGFARASESNFSMEIDGKTPSIDGAFDTEAFWKECYESSSCHPAAMEKDNSVDSEKIAHELLALYEAVAIHFSKTIASTDIDPRHDSSFALVLYALYLLLGLTSTRLDQRAEGRVTLRCIAEAFITLHWLTKKDDPSIWTQHRNYGVGQSKLSLLKNVDLDEVPDFLDLSELEVYANEDYWQEFTDIDLGAWANKNLRTLADESGAKEVYDKYYDWSSAYVHSNWGALRDTVMTPCLNPLHRFHRVPRSPKFEMPSVLADGSKLVNRMIDDLNTLYPTFKPRISWHHKESGDKTKAGKPSRE